MNNNYIEYFLIFLNLFFFIKAEIEIPKCSSGYSVKDCQLVKPFTPESFCTYYDYLYVARVGGEIGCRHELARDTTSLFELKKSNVSELLLNTTAIADVDLSKIVAINCSGNGNGCSQTKGFIKDKNSKYYKIVKSKDDKNVEADISKTSCPSSNVGNLATISNEVVLCLSDNIYVSLLENGRSNYFLKALKELPTSSPFYDTHLYQTISVDSYSFVLNSQLSAYIMYDYDTNKLFNINDEITAISLMNTMYSCNNGFCTLVYQVGSTEYLFGSTIYSFTTGEKGKVTVEIDRTDGLRIFQDFNRYYRIVPEESLNEKTQINTAATYRIFDCFGGYCESSNGYIKFKSDYKDITVAHCNPECRFIVQNEEFECNLSNVNKSFYGEVTKMCVGKINSAGEVTYEFIILNSELPSKYIFSYESDDTFILYVTNNSGNALGYGHKSGGYYGDIDGDGKEDFLLCKDSLFTVTCKRGKAHGYFINMFSKESNKLIYCTENKTEQKIECIIVAKDNGYYVNYEIGGGSTLIKCANSVCKVQEYSYNNQNSNELFEVTTGFNSASFYDFNGGLLYFDEYGPYFYPLKGIDAKSSIFPEVIKKGSDTILLRIDQYSLTQYTSSSYGIWIINGDNIADSECNSEQSTKYICEDIHQTCITDNSKNKKCPKNYSIDDDNKNSDNSSSAFHSLPINLFSFTLFIIISLYLLY